VAADPPSRPASTYRLQLAPGFGFAEAAETAEYLADLGVTHVYLSPVLQAAPGSGHGYDVADHSRISADLGGEAGLRAMAERFRRCGLGVIADIVPNHMAVPVPEYRNRQLWSVLRDGAASPFAHWFDVGWQAEDGRLLLPILAGPAEDCLADLIVGEPGADGPGLPADEPVLRYFDHVLPLRAGTARLPLPELLAAQHYRLADWRSAATELNWRRFFDISSLIAIRAEDPGVFEASHRLVLGLLADGLVDGLRVDHPDGLADPRGYLARLAAATGGAWVTVEKILAGAEELPPDWACHGTTGYDALAEVSGLFLDPAGAGPLTTAYQGFTGNRAGFGETAAAAKRQAVGGGLAAEVSRLTGLLARAGSQALAGLGPADLREILTELLAAFGVYRAYVVPGEPAPPAAVTVVGQAAAAAASRLPGRLHQGLAAVTGLVLGGGSGPASDEAVVRFQQLSGAVMAKGVEDTAFYRWSRLTALNEVGCEPGRLGTGLPEFHAFAARIASDWPATMTTLSTHDTKRQEDVRARLWVLAEQPAEWAAAVSRWHDAAVALAGGRLPEPDTEYLCWQTLAGAWPVTAERLADYLRKAIREAKTRTSWTSPDPGYESAVLGFAGAVLADPGIAADVAAFVASIGPAARANSLGAKLVQLTMPGVADVYQGCELTGRALVDPDNRRPVDFAARRRLLAALDGGQPSAAGGDAAGDDAALDADKLRVTAAALRLRRDHPDWSGGSYQPLAAAGPAAGHAVAFCRGGQAVTVATRLSHRLRQAGGWQDTVLPLPEGRWRDVLTGAEHPGGSVPLAQLTRRLPVALLVRATPR
jgi:(1->4)-alpha-D-glucan 1-alpha-D-glucosylmutase